VEVLRVVFDRDRVQVDDAEEGVALSWVATYWRIAPM
jgi:hypothetical protein